MLGGSIDRWVGFGGLGEAMIRSSESPEVKVKRSVVSNVGEIVGDAATLAELQFQLLQADVRESTRQLVLPLIFTIAGVFLMAGCFPIALLTLASLIHEVIGLSMFTSAGIALLVGAAAAGCLLVAGGIGLRKAMKYFDRTISELKKNIDWLKQLKGGLGADQRNN